MHPCIHVYIIIEVQKENHNMSCIIKSSIILHKIIENHFKKKSTMIIFCVSLTNVRHSHDVCRHFKSKIQVLLLYIKTLYKSMVIDFLCHIEALYEAMVIDLFTSRPFARQWSLISYVTSRPSARQWSTMIIFCVSLTNVRHSRDVCRHFKSKIRVLLLYIKTLYKAMVIDFLCHIEALYEAMVINLFTSRPFARQWSLISYVTSRPYARQWSSISLHQDPLRGNGH